MPDPEMIDPEDWLPHRDVPRPKGWRGNAVLAIFIVLTMVVLGVIFWPLLEILGKWFMA